MIGTKWKHGEHEKIVEKWMKTNGIIFDIFSSAKKRKVDESGSAEKGEFDFY